MAAKWFNSLDTNSTQRQKIVDGVEIKETKFSSSTNDETGVEKSYFGRQRVIGDRSYTVKTLITFDDGAVCQEEELIETNMEDFELEIFNNEWKSLNPFGWPSIRYDEPCLLIELTGFFFIFIFGLGLKRFFQMINPF